MTSEICEALGHFGFAAGVEYAEAFEWPWLKRETVEYLTLTLCPRNRVKINE